MHTIHEFVNYSDIINGIHRFLGSIRDNNKPFYLFTLTIPHNI